MRFPSQRLARPYLAAAAVSLLIGATAGLAASVPHGWPQALTWLPLQKLRPLHTTFAIAWIFLAYMGALFYFVPEVVGHDWRHSRMALFQLGLLTLAGIVSASAYYAGVFRGREYLEFPLLVSCLILGAYLLFAFNFFATIRRRPRPWPAYLWMWATGVALFPLTFLEGHTYLLSFYASSVVRDEAVQWKSYGTLIGSWNMVVYGLALYLNERIERRDVRWEAEAYLLYWLGLFNLMFGFAHHTYPLPQARWLRELAFAVSMTEWVVLLRLLWPNQRQAPQSGLPSRLLSAAAFWVGVNLLLALLLSIPWINAITHGTHVTVAHAMGTTIGINTLILLASGFHIMGEEQESLALPIVHWSLAVFLLSLLGAGLAKGISMVAFGLTFYEAMAEARPMLRLTVASGLALWVGLSWMALVWLRSLLLSRVLKYQSLDR